MDRVALQSDRGTARGRSVGRERMAGMSTYGRVSLSIVGTIGGFIVGFLVGFYASFAFGANIHDVIPGVAGLACGIVGAGAAATQTRKCLTQPEVKQGAAN